MNWRNRLLGITLAGGTTALAAACGTTAVGGGQCNANPDPCCSDPGGAACKAKGTGGASSTSSDGTGGTGGSNHDAGTD